MMKKCFVLALVGLLGLAGCAPTGDLQNQIAPGLSWRVTNLNGGAEAALFEPDGRRAASMRCQSGRLSVDVPTFKPTIGPAPQSLYLHLGSAPIPLTQDFRGATAGGPPPGDIAERILAASEFRVVLGDQVLGPYIPPTGPEAKILASACMRVASS
jgi:hypothetical protein